MNLYVYMYMCMTYNPTTPPTTAGSPLHTQILQLASEDQAIGDTMFCTCCVVWMVLGVSGCVCMQSYACICVCMYNIYNILCIDVHMHASGWRRVLTTNPPFYPDYPDLGRLLEGRKVDISTYLNHIRRLSREQFFARATSRLARKTARLVWGGGWGCGGGVRVWCGCGRVGG